MQSDRLLALDRTRRQKLVGTPDHSKVIAYRRKGVEAVFVPVGQLEWESFLLIDHEKLFCDMLIYRIVRFGWVRQIKNI